MVQNALGPGALITTANTRVMWDTPDHSPFSTVGYFDPQALAIIVSVATRWDRKQTVLILVAGTGRVGWVNTSTLVVQ